MTSFWRHAADSENRANRQVRGTAVKMYSFQSFSKWESAVCRSRSWKGYETEIYGAKQVNICEYILRIFRRTHAIVQVFRLFAFVNENLQLFLLL